MSCSLKIVPNKPCPWYSWPFGNLSYWITCYWKTEENKVRGNATSLIKLFSSRYQTVSITSCMSFVEAAYLAGVVLMTRNWGVASGNSQQETKARSPIAFEDQCPVNNHESELEVNTSLVKLPDPNHGQHLDFPLVRDWNWAISRAKTQLSLPRVLIHRNWEVIKIICICLSWQALERFFMQQ